MTFTGYFFCGQSLQLEVAGIHEDVDEVRDCAIDLMTRSGRYKKMVEPELTHLNQRWEEVTDRLKVGHLSGLFREKLKIDDCLPATVLREKLKVDNCLLGSVFQEELRVTVGLLVTVMKEKLKVDASLLTSLFKSKSYSRNKLFGQCTCGKTKNRLSEYCVPIKS